MDLKSKLKQLLLNNRPNLSQNTVKTYISVLSTLYNRVTNNSENVDINVFNDTEAMLKYISIFNKNQSKKTILSSLFVLTGNLVFQEKMKEYSKLVNESYKDRKTDPNRLKNKPTIEQLKEIYKEYKHKLDINPTIENYMNYFIVSVSSGIIMPVRRNLDWTEMKIRNYNKITDNCILQKQFLFNQFKTVKYVKPENRFVDIPNELNKYIKRYKKLNVSDYLLIKKNGKKFSSSELTKKLNSIYGNHIGIDVLRSVSLQQDKDLIDALAVLKKKTTEMGTSVESASNFYIKNDI